MWPLYLIVLLGSVHGQPPPGTLALGDMASNMERFGQIYGIATQLMSMGTDFMRSGSGSPAGSPRDGGNSVLGEVVRPSLRNAASYPSDPYASEFGGLQRSTGGRPKSGIQSILNTFLGSTVSDNEALPPPPPPPKPRQQAAPRTILDMFGMGPPTDPPPPTTYAPTTQKPRNILELFGLVPTTTPPPTTTTRRPSFLDFLGSALPDDPQFAHPRRQRNILDSFLGGSAPSREETKRQAPIVDMLEMFGLMETTTTTHRPKLFDSRSGFGMGTKGASDIDGILNALMRGGARPVEPEAPSAAGLFSQFFGKKRK